MTPFATSAGHCTAPSPTHARRCSLAGIALVLAGGLSGCIDAPAPTAPGAEPAASGQLACDDLRGARLTPGAVVTDADIAPATGTYPESCVVHVSFQHSTLRVEARLPTQGWNRKMVFLGGGGFDGRFPDAAQPYFSPSVLSERYATVSTNGGYDYPGMDPAYFDAAFARDHDTLVDFTHASEHRAVPVADALLAKYFGTSPERSYFEGCSMGGHDALIQAQRYPEDFDGIVARGPAGNIMGLMLQFHRIATAARRPDLDFGSAQTTLLARAVLAHCDGLDGLEDGVVSNLAACRFDASTLRCPPGVDENCLSDEHLAFVDTVITPIQTVDGRWTHPGFPLTGGEDSSKGWAEYILPQAMLGGSTLQALFSDGFLRSFISGDAALDTTSWRHEEWLPRLAEVGAMFNADNADLSGFHARGGKLILHNGTLDTSVSMHDSIRYYEAVVAELGEERAKETIELYLAPGVGHCFGGVGPDRVDLLAALSVWVEQGIAPSSQGLVHRTPAAAGESLSRPACAYPAYPRYTGSGDPRDAANFDCAVPDGTTD
jgi:hypothetical protein